MRKRNPAHLAFAAALLVSPVSLAGEPPAKVAAATPAAPAPAAITVGVAAPAFENASTDGKSVKLAQFLGKKKVVLAFFPRAFTGGCTREMESFRDRLAQFDTANAQVLGVSTDDVETQKKFTEKLKLSFPLLSDAEFKTSKLYGVLDGKVAKRTTFVIDLDGKVVKIVEGVGAISPDGAYDACVSPSQRPQL